LQSKASEPEYNINEDEEKKEEKVRGGAAVVHAFM